MANNPYGLPSSFINSSITPTNPYSPQQTQDTVNQTAAGISAQNNPNVLMKQMGFNYNNGVSAGPAQMARMAMPMAQGNAQINQAMNLIPYQNNLNNAYSMLGGQQAQASNGLNLAQLASQQMQQQYGLQGQQLGMGMGLLNALMGQGNGS